MASSSSDRLDNLLQQTKAKVMQEPWASKNPFEKLLPLTLQNGVGFSFNIEGKSIFV